RRTRARHRRGLRRRLPQRLLPNRGRAGADARDHDLAGEPTDRRGRGGGVTPPAVGAGAPARPAHHERRTGVALGALVAVAALLAPLVLSRAHLTIYVLLGTAAMVTVGVSLLM